MPLNDYRDDPSIPLEPSQPDTPWWSRALAILGAGAGKAWNVVSTGLDYLDRPFQATWAPVQAIQERRDPIEAARQGWTGETKTDWRDILQPQTQSWWSLPSMAGELWAPFQYVGNWMLDPWYDTGVDYEAARGQAKDAAVQGLGMGLNLFADPLNAIPITGVGGKAWQAIGKGIDDLARLSPRFRGVLHALSPRYRGAAEDLNEIMRLGRADVQRLERAALDELAEVRNAYEGLDPQVRSWIDDLGIGDPTFEEPGWLASVLKSGPPEGMVRPEQAAELRQLGERLERSADVIYRLREIAMATPVQNHTEAFELVSGLLTKEGREALKNAGLNPESPGSWLNARPDLADEIFGALQGRTLYDAPDAIRDLSVFRGVEAPVIADPYIAQAILSARQARETASIDLSRDVLTRFGWVETAPTQRLAERGIGRPEGVPPWSREGLDVTPSGRAAQTGVPVTNRYVTGEGETLASVAERFGVTVDELRAANPGLPKDPDVPLGRVALDPPEGFRPLSREAQDFLRRATRGRDMAVVERGGEYYSGIDMDRAIQRARFHPEVAGEIEQAIRNWQAAGPETVLHALDRYMGAWKGWTTAPVPSYHTRNMVSNVWQNLLVGVRDPRVYDEAYRVMRGEAMVRVAGRELSSDDIMRMAREQGILDTGFAAADIRRTVSQAAGEATGVYETVQQVPESLLRLASNYENHARLANFIDGLKHGLSPAEAALRTKKALFDYGDLTAIERDVLKRVMGFYTFTARNLPLQLETLVTQPGVFSALNRIPDQLSDQPPIGLSDWQADTPGIIRDGTYYGLGGAIPSADLYGWFASPQEELVNWVGPWTTPIQLLANYDTFSRRPIADPPASQGDPTGFPTSQGVPVPLWLDYLLANMAPGGRELNLLRSVVEPTNPVEQGDPLGMRVLNRAVTPVPGYPLRPEAIGWGIQDQQQRIRYILEQAGMARTDAEREYWLQLLDQALQEGI